MQKGKRLQAVFSVDPSCITVRWKQVIEDIILLELHLQRKVIGWWCIRNNFYTVRDMH